MEEKVKKAYQLIDKVKYLIEPDKNKWAETFAQSGTSVNNDKIDLGFITDECFFSFYIVDKYGVYKHHISGVNGVVFYDHYVPMDTPNCHKLGYVDNSLFNRGYLCKDFYLRICDKQLWKELMEFDENLRPTDFVDL